MTASLAPLFAWNALTGERFGSEAQSLFFYAYCRMRRPEIALELGTGLGHSALWIAQAMEENGTGHVWSVDNGARWPELREFLAELHRDPGMPELLARVANDLGRPAPGGDDATEHADFARRLSAAVGLNGRVTFLAGTASLADITPVTGESHPFLRDAIARPIDLLYADFDHAPDAILAILAKYLPLMSESASIFIDCASTYLPSHLVLEQTVEQLDRGKLPAIFFAGTTLEQRACFEELVATRRFRYIPLPERRDRRQNGLAWLQIEPVNVVPYPLGQVQGLSVAPMSQKAMEAFFERGQVPDRRT